MQVQFVDLQTQYRQAKEAVDSAMQSVIERGDYILGQAVSDFEAAFADFCEAKQAIGVDSGYSAIELILRACDIGPGDEVIVPANTFIASALPVVRCGARPVFVDSQPDSFAIDPDLIEAAITPATRAIIVVHLYGQPVYSDAIQAIADRYALRIIEDACQAHGARYKGRRAGGLGDAAAFSFYPTKNLGAFGDGGAVVTNDELIGSRVRLLRNLGQPEKNVHAVVGYNHRLDTLQAAVLQAQLPLLETWNRRRREHAARYNERLSPLPVQTPYVRPDVEHVYHLYVVKTGQREALRQWLGERGIATAIHYPTPIHLQPALQHLRYRKGDFPVAEQGAEQILSLPMHPFLSAEQIDYVVDTIDSFFAQRR
jgi:dTDP-4-amino-4,6-dideoxygalactose transaminase